MESDRAIGSRRWAIADGYLPGWSNGPEPELTSHESFSVLNANDEDASLRVTIYFEDRDPQLYELTVPAQRTLHQRFNELEEPQIPRGLGYSGVIESDLPVVVQHTRLDSRQRKNALLSTIAYPDPGSD
jgi:hypothetical protein